MVSTKVFDEERCRQKFTVLKRWGGSWSERDIRRLGGLKPISTHPNFPEFVILFGEVSRKSIMDVVDRHFNRTVVSGFNNPRLPYEPTEQ